MRETARAILHAAAALAVLLAWVTLPARSEETATGKADTGGLQTRITIGGTTLTCRDFRGSVVRAIRMDDIGDVAHARVINRMPIITLNQSRLDTLPVKLQIFFFHHECGHHVMGHVFYPTATSENEADCWAIKLGRSQGQFTRKDVEDFAPHLARSRGSPFGHLPGPLRAQRLLACFDDPSEENLTDPLGFTPPAPQLAEGMR
jgi:hypothetical protein